MSAKLTQSLQTVLQARQAAGNFRQLHEYTGIDFCSNDYLGLGRFPITSDPHASGSTGSRLISGHASALTAFEQELAAFHGYEHSLLFGSGYAANSGLLACIAGKDDAILSDELIHASLIDGIRLSYAVRARFKHNDVEHLEAQLQSLQTKVSGQIYVVIESLYSMDGDIAPLKEISQICQNYNAALIVDEAHAIGAYGPQGRGLISEFGLTQHVFAAIYTFGKAVGMHGAVITGSNVLRDYLINFCRPFIYSTAPSPQIIADTRQAYQRFQNADKERDKLKNVLEYFETHVKKAPLKDTCWLDSQSPIQGLIVPGNERAKSLGHHMKKNGFAIKAILSPTVTKGAERLRISLHSHNTKKEMDDLRGCLVNFLNGAT